MSNAVERNTHRNLKLGSRKVDTGNHLGGRVFDLETEIEFEELEGISSVTVEI